MTSHVFSVFSVFLCVLCGSLLLIRYHPHMRLLAIFLLATLPAIAQNDRPVTPPPEPIVNPDHSVTFRLTFPNALKVSLALENQPPTPMQKDDTGRWTVTVPALDPQYYSYHFTVDGTTVLDPLNPKVVESYTSAGNVLLVPAPTPGPWERTAVPHGVVHVHAFTSSVVPGLPASQSVFYVYTPPGYDPRAATKYPVLYLLHGYSDTAAGWTNIGHADNILDNLIAQGKARPMIVVMPLGYGDMSFLRNGFGVWRDPAAVDHNTSLFSQTLLTEVLPQVEKLYNVSARREDRAITGLSMGGLEALTVGLTHTGQFAWVGGFSAAVHNLKPGDYPVLDPKKANLKLVYISVGMKDDLLEPDRRYAAALRAEGQPVTTEERENLGHVWLEWRPDLAFFASKIFQGTP